MKVKHWMTPEPVTVEPDMLIVDAKNIMKQKNIRRLPVVSKGKLVGIVTYRNVIEASPSAATSLSIHELNYLILKLQVKDVMRKQPIAVAPDDSVIDVMLEGAKKGIGAFPVVEKGKLIGIITETEIFNAMIQIFGTRAESEIIDLEMPKAEEGDSGIRQIIRVLDDMNVSVQALFTLPNRDTGGTSLFVRVKTKETGPIIKALEQAGFASED